MDDSPACTRRVDQSLFLTIFKAHVTGGSAVVLRLLLRLLLTTTSRPTGARRPYVWSTETTRVVGALLQRVGCAVAHTGNEPPGVSNRSFGGSVRRHEPRHNLPVRSLELARRYELNANGSPVDAISCKKIPRCSSRLSYNRQLPTAPRDPRRHGRLPAARQQQRQTS